MSIQYIVLDPTTMAVTLPWSAVAEQPEYKAADSPFVGDDGLLEDIGRITEPYSTLFAELADFEPTVPAETALPCEETTLLAEPIHQFLTPPASPPTVSENADQLLAIANELLDLRKSPIEFDSLFKSVEAEVKNWEDEALSPFTASSSDYDVMSPDGIYDNLMSDSSYDETSSYATLDPDYASLLSEPSQIEHSYSRPRVEDRKPVSVRKETRKQREAKKPRSKYTAEDRKLRKKEQNKQAAIRYRQKKKEELLRFASHEKDLIQTNRSLMREANKIRAEIRIVKNIMRDHFAAKGLL